MYGVQLPGHDGKAGAAAIYIDPAHQRSFSYADLLKYVLHPTSREDLEHEMLLIRLTRFRK